MTVFSLLDIHWDRIFVKRNAKDLFEILIDELIDERIEDILLIEHEYVE